MRLPEALRSTTFRWTLAIAGAVAACNLFMATCFYLRTTMYLTSNIDAAIAEAASLIAASSPEDATESIIHRLRDDPRRVKLAGLFNPDGKRLLGNIATLPGTLALDGHAHATVLPRIDSNGTEAESARAVAIRQPSGNIVVVGRDVDEMREVAATVDRGIVLQLVPALLLA